MVLKKIDLFTMATWAQRLLLAGWANNFGLNCYHDFVSMSTLINSRVGDLIYFLYS